MKKVLFTTPVLEHPPANGPQLRIENSIKALSPHCELHLYSRLPMEEIGGKAAEEFYSRYFKKIAFDSSHSFQSKNKFIRKFQHISGILDRMTLRQILAYIDREQIEIVWFGYGNISFPLMQGIKKARPHLKLICDTDSVWSRFVLRGLPYEKSAVKKARRWMEGQKKILEERAWVKMCDATLAVSEVDQDYYRSLGGNASKVRLFYNVIDLQSYQNRPPRPAALKSPAIYLAGYYGIGSPMEEAALWVIREVLPLLKKKIPNVHFYIVGNGSKETMGAYASDSITVTGKLPSVLDYLCHVDVALVPLKFESGTRFKILEAAACEVPIVSTTLGAEGLPVTHGKDILIADEPAAFAEAIETIIRKKDFARQLTVECKELVRRGYSVESLSNQAADILESVSDVSLKKQAS